MSYNKISIGQNIKRERLERGLTKEQFARMLMLTSSHLGAIENGRRVISCENLCKLNQLFNISYSNILSCDDLTVTDKNIKTNKETEITVMAIAEYMYNSFNELELPFILDILTELQKIRNSKDISLNSILQFLTLDLD